LASPHLKSLAKLAKASFTHCSTSYIIFIGYSSMFNKTVNRDISGTIREGLPPIVCLPLLGERPCLDFVNTIDWRLQPDKYCDTLTSYMDLLAFSLRRNLIVPELYAELSELATAQPNVAFRSFTEARAFRDALSRIFEDIAGTPMQEPQLQPDRKALALFDAARRRAHISESLAWHSGRMVLEPQPKQESLDLPWLLIVRDAEELLCSSNAARIKVCAAEGCGWVFLDTSKNGTRRWCSMKLCGNREKARRFKEKKPEN
jgi:predicted RNA-binding Zn ribbon-like protein